MRTSDVGDLSSAPGATVAVLFGVHRNARSANANPGERNDAERGELMSVAPQNRFAYSVMGTAGGAIENSNCRNCFDAMFSRHAQARDRYGICDLC